MDDEALRQQLATLACGLSGDELRVVVRIADRLLIGRRQYGQLDADDGRDWLEEGVQEALDLAAYMAIELERVRRARGGA